MADGRHGRQLTISEGSVAVLGVNVLYSRGGDTILLQEFADFNYVVIQDTVTQFIQKLKHCSGLRWRPARGQFDQLWFVTMLHGGSCKLFARHDFFTLRAGAPRNAAFFSERSLASLSR